MSQQQSGPNFNVHLPPEKVAGHYADFASVWHNRDTFILDFLAMSQPTSMVTDEAGERTPQINAEVVSRVRIPADQVWELMKALETQLGRWEQENPDRKHE